MISIIYSMFSGTNWEGRVLGACMLLDFIIQFALLTALYGKFVAE